MDELLKEIQDNTKHLVETLTYDKKPALFIVFGNKAEKDFSNVKTINTTVIPNIGETIMFQNNVYKVMDKFINYKMVENYTLGDEGRGGEMIYIFVKPN